MDQIKSELTQAVKNKNRQLVSTLRYFLSNLHNEEISRQKPLSDEEIQLLIRRQVKKHQESIEAFKKGGRGELALKEEEERKILERFLPAQMSEDEIRKIVTEVIASGAGDFGQIMGQTMGRLKGQADGAVVARIVREELQR